MLGDLEHNYWITTNYSGCGGSIGSGSEKSGEIVVSKEFPSPELDGQTNVRYAYRQSCMWHITVPKGYDLMVLF